MIKSILLIATLIIFVSCRFNLDGIDTLFEDQSITEGRLIWDAPRNRVIVTSPQAVHFIDVVSKKAIPISMSQYESLSGEFLDSNGQYHVFGKRTGMPGLYQVSIDGNGKVTMTVLKSLINNVQCAIHKPNTNHLFLTTMENTSNELIAYDFVLDKIMGKFPLVELFGNDCAFDASHNMGYFVSSYHIAAVDLTDVENLRATLTLLPNTTVLPIGNYISVDPINQLVYIATITSQKTLQYHADSRKISIFDGDQSSLEYSGYLGLAAHPKDGSVYFFSNIKQGKSNNPVNLVATDMNLKTVNSYEIPNEKEFIEAGYFDLERDRMYVLGHTGMGKGLAVFSVSTHWLPFGLSQAAIIGISVGAGVLLLLLATLCIWGLYSLSKKHHYTKTTEERTVLLTNGRILAKA